MKNFVHIVITSIVGFAVGYCIGVVDKSCGDKKQHEINKKKADLYADSIDRLDCCTSDLYEEIKDIKDSIVSTLDNTVSDMQSELDDLHNALTSLNKKGGDKDEQ